MFCFSSWFLEPPTVFFVRRPSLSRTLNITPNNRMSVGCRSAGLSNVKFAKYSDFMFHVLKPFSTSKYSAACSVGTTWLGPYVTPLLLKQCLTAGSLRIVNLNIFWYSDRPGTRKVQGGNCCCITYRTFMYFARESWFVRRLTVDMWQLGQGRFSYSDILNLQNADVQSLFLLVVLLSLSR